MPCALSLAGFGSEQRRVCAWPNTLHVDLISAERATGPEGRLGLDQGKGRGHAHGRGQAAGEEGKAVTLLTVAAWSLVDSLR